VELIGALMQFALGRPRLYGIPSRVPALKLGRTIYRPPHYPRAMSRAAAALILATRDDAVREAASRRETGALWRHSLTTDTRLRVIDPPARATAGFLRFPTRVLGPDEHRRLLLERGRRLGIAPTYPSTLAQVPALRTHIMESNAPTPGADTLVRQLITLPTHSLLSAEDRQSILSLCESARTRAVGCPDPLLSPAKKREVNLASRT
jgi:dTDP-4-amino-4,6-dideoxygalactose transaminase